MTGWQYYSSDGVHEVYVEVVNIFQAQCLRLSQFNKCLLEQEAKWDIELCQKTNFMHNSKPLDKIVMYFFPEAKQKQCMGRFYYYY